MIPVRAVPMMASRGYTCAPSQYEAMAKKAKKRDRLIHANKEPDPIFKRQNPRNVNTDARNQ